jgi:hypothetical protein
MPQFRKGMRVVYRGEYGTVGGSEFDEETRKYSRYVLLDGERWEILVDVKHLRPLTEGEWFLELMENDKHKWTEQRIGNILRNLKIDVTRLPKYRGIPLKPYKTGLGRPLSLFDEELADQV